ncbi:MAG: Rpn family recombination-promoting nuclease/putative transposase, partial [Pseudomonadota bacterium]|nr:Rpn family recombination-promoting nuclease/putative transposase [Pseudomonadota bacterium]
MSLFNSASTWKALVPWLDMPRDIAAALPSFMRTSLMRGSMPKRPVPKKNLHDEFFKKVFKRPKYLMELLDIILPDHFQALLAADSLTITDGTLLKSAGGEMRTDRLCCISNAYFFIG